MHTAPANLPLDLVAKIARVLLGPVQELRKEVHCRGLERLEAVLATPDANLLFAGVVHVPGPNGPNGLLLDNGLEAGEVEQLLEARGGVAGAAHELRGLHQERGPARDGAVGGHGVVVAHDGEGVVLKFNVAAGLEVAF